MTSFLRPPTAEELQQVPISSRVPSQKHRASVEYKSHDQRFTLKKTQYTQQFSHIYQRRLNKLQNPVREAAQRRWGDETPLCERLVQMRSGETWACVGTVFKAMRLKPSVLEEYKEERGISAAILVPAGHFAAEDDTLYLEDNSGRIALIGGTAMPAQDFCTGAVLAVKGVVQPGGQLEVEDWCPAGLPMQPPPPSPNHVAENGEMVMLVSGLLSGGSHDPLPTRLMLDYLAAYVGGEGDHDAASKIVRVIVCGDSVAEAKGVPPPSAAEKGKNKRNKLTASHQHALGAPLRECDRELAQIAAAAPVDVMPGSSDPAIFTLPQQPLHPLLFPLATQYGGTLKLVTNPHEAWIGGRLFLGNSGQVLADMEKYMIPDETDSDTRTDRGEWGVRILSQLLELRHMAPTAPDTLGCYPFVTDDPFVLEECPHVFFSGNCETFGTSYVEGSEGQKVRVICVPSFSSTGQAVLVNLTTLECELLSFNVQGLEGGNNTEPSPMEEG